MSDNLTTIAAITIAQLVQHIRIGDLVFIRVSALPFQAVADATGTWTNHVGLITHTEGTDPRVGESTFPFSRTTCLSKFIARSDHGQVAVARLNFDLTQQQIGQVQTAANRRQGILYDTGFNMHSERQFCSRYVHEIIKEATGVFIGQIETFKEMLLKRPTINLNFWKLWYFGQIPWERETITPASLLQSAELHSIFYGHVIKKPTESSFTP